MVKADPLIVALDVEDFQNARKIVLKLSPPVRFYKVGLKLFTREGPRVVQWLKRRAFRVFLDLKFHDIPNTAADAVESVCRLGVDMVTVHALGGEEMMRAAVKSARLASKKFKKPRPKILAVTVLTSQSRLGPLGISATVEKQVLRLARLAEKSGVDGLVCSPQEVGLLKRKFGDRFLLVTPGIRLDSRATDDQKRVATPKEAFSAGADYLVVGRPILNSPHPQETANQIIHSFFP